jgi:excisionase family DNA binding protein
MNQQMNDEQHESSKQRAWDNYLDKKEAAAYLNLSLRMMTRLADERRIPFYKLGKFTRWKMEDLNAWAEASRVEATK